MNGTVGHTTGDIKEAIERTEAAEAYRREHLERRLGKDAAEKYLANERKQRGR